MEQLPNSAWYRIQQQSIVGTMDVIGVIDGFPTALELKASEKLPPTAIQIYMLKKFNDAGGFAFVCYPENWLAIFGFYRMITSKEYKNEDHLRTVAKSLSFTGTI